MLSGIAYGVACGNSKKEIEQLLSFIYDGKVDEYDLIVFLQGDTEVGLKTAVSSKQEFEGGDAMEAKGLSFMKEVEAYFYQLMKTRKNVVVVNVVNKSREDILSEIIQAVHNLFK
jgi:thymidylate kinase